ncbi:hypothetical protein H920_15397 [Fukomys damarensis]|uniref:Uncharacterized protein n=1 Tax=Fukomys damarensis TaxID=885580 RepID=A0A091CX31_FUKDA|nr:hypothetical protein H920_15397 [Fukomys damarensis]
MAPGWPFSKVAPVILAPGLRLTSTAVAPECGRSDGHQLAVPPPRVPLRLLSPAALRLGKHLSFGDDTTSADAGDFPQLSRSNTLAALGEAFAMAPSRMLPLNAEAGTS